MALPWIANETIVPVSPGAVGGYGDEQLDDWNNTTDHDPITGCSVQYSQTMELTSMGREIGVAVVTAYLPMTDPPLTNAMGFRWRGQLYRVQGEIQQWYDPTPLGLDHSIAQGKRTLG